ncbi:MAG: hypothetical protein M3Z22_04255 [Verrucomicrobiota bacterium]|nr:hypothetical protein [Verrucomicrobiota bacterium]
MLFLDSPAQSPAPASVATPPASEPMNAVAYRKAHHGKLMVFQRKAGGEPNAADFFLFDSVGTHPTGLLVTGIFEQDRRSHMLSAAVRDATPAEIAAREHVQG